MSGRIPILVNHDPHALIGHAEWRGDRLLVRLLEPMRRDDFFKTFGGAGMVAVERHFDADGVDWVTVAEILEFSLCPGPAEPPVGS